MSTFNTGSGMRNFKCILVSACICMITSVQAAVITGTKNPVGWKIETALSSYQIAVAQDLIVIPLYYGPKGNMAEVRAPAVNVEKKIGSKIREVPFRGGFIEQTPAVEVVFADGTRDCDLQYVKSEIFERGGLPCLRVDMKDSVYGLMVSEFIRVVPESDILEKWLVLRNDGNDIIRIENAQSGSIWLEANEYELVHFSGKWAHEFMLEKTVLSPGVKTLQCRDLMGWASPWFAVRPLGKTTELHGPVWFGEVAYSGNWRIDFEKTADGNVQIVGGINFWDTAVELQPKREFTTAKMVFGFAPDGMNGASQRLHNYIRTHVLRPKFAAKPHPVLYNSWFATTFDVNEQHQLELAKIAKEIGVELFVIDDGWFKGRVNDQAGLGDWTVDKNKFPNGLTPLIKKINELGMDFGIWIEPEMTNANSDLYRRHPDWVLRYPKRTAHEHRNQLVLNLAREDVYQYLLASFDKFLGENNIKFIKWDHNRAITEPGWPDAPIGMQREVRIRYIENLYRLVDELQSRHPDVMFETCSGGGSRIDLGILSRMDQAWPSDNTCPGDRIMMQYAYLNAYPANTMDCWVTSEDWRREKPSLKFRFDVSSSGVLGIGADITKWSAEERKIAAEKIAQYKTIRGIVQLGDVYRLQSPFEGQRAVLEYISPDSSEAVIFLYNIWDTLPQSTPTTRGYNFVRLVALDPKATYSLNGDWQGKEDGETLMNIGVPWFVYGNFNSGVVVVKKK
jgi:alpha-galactosidase